MRVSLLVRGLPLCLLAACAGGKGVTGGAGSNGTGTAGATGAAGVSGAAGTTGAAGATGVAGSGAVGTAGSTGAAGATGAAGTGTTGAAGSTGAAGATGAAGTGTTGTAGASGTAGATGAAGSTATDAGTDALCQTAEYMFQPMLPTVYLVVDRSGSMFDCLSTTNVEPSCPTQSDTSWSKLKDAVLMVVQALETQVRFGFASFSGTNPASGGTCPIIDEVAPKVMNLADITSKYNALAFPPNTTASGMKFESPATFAVSMVGAELMADTSPGAKYIMFVTDGELDYCDDGTPFCASDDVIGQLQRLKAAGITTLVMGLQTSNFNLPTGTLQAFANAGAGEPTVIQPPSGGNATTLFDQCQPKAQWKADFLAVAPASCATDLNSCRGMTIGTYSAAAGPTKPLMPNAADQTMLVTQLGTAISAVKSCVFDLSDVGGKSIKVDLTKLDAAHVQVEGQDVPRNDTNGWKMNSQTQLELVGTACKNWQTPSANKIDFMFPCSTIIFE
jgi:hypothetical protein